MPQALALVKRQLGADAVIVNTRTVKHGGVLGIGARSVVEITAQPAQAFSTIPTRAGASDRLRRAYAPPANLDAAPTRIKPARASNRIAPDTRPATAPSKPDTPPIYPMDQQLKTEMTQIRALVENLVKEQRHLHAPQMPEQLFDMYLDLIQREVADEIAYELISNVQRDMTGNQMLNAHVVRQKLIEVMDRMINAGGPICPSLNDTARVVALIGPTGVGKTTTIAKLAANFKLRQNKKVGLITLDTYRIGAVDQLRMYAQIINVPLRVVLTPAELTEAITLMQDVDIILIDTAGRSQNDELKLQELQTFLNAAKPHEVHLVLSSTAHHTHMLSAAEKFKTLGVDHIILTKLDEAISFGVFLSVMRKVDASISYITTGQDVPDDIEVGTGRKLAQMLLQSDATERTALDMTVDNQSLADANLQTVSAFDKAGSNEKLALGAKL